MPAPVDAKTPEGSVVMRDFPGLSTKSDALDLTPGAARVQVNLMSTVPGELTVRQGLREVRFEG